ncbi:hypothetical protein MEG_01276 [Bartonella tamiae Th307]|uniref:Uncharacterized protein n=1 Tax=Bartonella tamiae Th239 TaxID=1094558 RepID=J0ZRF2_9HYPH|nr:hypothetical protein ME5_00605 [Bartonella tamiae Th239]EJF93062.1 hypothetical protein MEG_01276 [Bartonella tamiae Th307]
MNNDMKYAGYINHTERLNNIMIHQPDYMLYGKEVL